MQQRTGNRVWNQGTGASDDTLDHGGIWARIDKVHKHAQYRLRCNAETSQVDTVAGVISRFKFSRDREQMRAALLLRKELCDDPGTDRSEHLIQASPA